MRVLAALIMTTVIASLGLATMIYGWGLHPISWPVVILGYTVIGLLGALGSIDRD